MVNYAPEFDLHFRFYFSRENRGKVSTLAFLRVGWF